MEETQTTKYLFVGNYCQKSNNQIDNKIHCIEQRKMNVNKTIFFCWEKKNEKWLSLVIVNRRNTTLSMQWDYPLKLMAQKMDKYVWYVCSGQCRLPKNTAAQFVINIKCIVDKY